MGHWHWAGRCTKWPGLYSWPHGSLTHLHSSSIHLLLHRSRLTGLGEWCKVTREWLMESNPDPISSWFGLLTRSYLMSQKVVYLHIFVYGFSNYSKDPTLMKIARQHWDSVETINGTFSLFLVPIFICYKIIFIVNFFPMKKAQRPI